MLGLMSEISPSQFESALGMPVEVREIEAALKKLWEDDHASTKASLVNFAIFSENPNVLERNTHWIQKITSETACRAILIDANFDEDLTPKIGAWVTAHCHLQGGAKSICSEQISFRLRGRMIGRMRNVIFAHLESDLPLLFWWQGSLAKSLAFEEGVYSQIDRLIIDSSSWSKDVSMATELELIEEVISKRGNNIVISEDSVENITKFPYGPEHNIISA